MKILRTILDTKNYIKSCKRSDLQIGFVPTMGSLHEGHLSLVKQSKLECDKSIVSIFVNPSQFGKGEDYKVYPRNEEKDIKLLQDLGVDVDAVFIPDVEEIYTSNFLTSIDISEVSNILCGKSRPGHFQGVLTIVLKLLNIINPDKLYLGQKDAQQAFIIKKMVSDLNLDVEVKVMPIIRDKDGLALSSRNVYLSEKQRYDALILYKSLKKAEEMIENGEKNAVNIEKCIEEQLNSIENLKIDYIAIVDYNNSLKSINKIKENTLIAIAVYIEKIRLIDNIIII